MRPRGKIFLWVFIFVLSTSGFAQDRNRSFSISPNARTQPGVVRVKVKAEFKQEFFESTQGQKSSLHFRAISPLIKPALARKGASWNGPRALKSSIDLQAYHTIQFDPAIDLKKYIRELYATGKFELVEPVYLTTPTFIPNDPRVNDQYYLNTIKAIEAWDITQGSDEITIAIIDTGGDLNHPDLVNKLYTNPGEIPGNGIDDDHDGYIDNYRGWDFVGADTLNLLLPDYQGDNDPSIHTGGDIRHGTIAAGCATAETNNGIGIAGVGFKTKVMFTKHTADNQRIKPAYLYNTLDGILYAANQGIRIINCSFGGSPPSQIEQDVINHVTRDLGCIIIAAAGNSADESLIYPAAYENVFSVAATDANDKAAFFTNYGTTVDIAAPGLDILTTSFDDDYLPVTGTSLSAPLVSGAAALVLAKYPSYSGLQIAEQLRIGADHEALYAANPGLPGKLGRGRLDIVGALSTAGPSIRASLPQLKNAEGESVLPGDKGLLSFDFTNYLSPVSSGFAVSISISSPFVTVTKGSIVVGAISTLQTKSNHSDPFEIVVSSDLPYDVPLNIELSYSDGSYSDTQVVTLILNPSWLDINANEILTSVAAAGRIGFQDPSGSSGGSGFVFNEEQLVFDMGLIMGTSSTTLFNNVRGSEPGAYDNSFVITKNISRMLPGVLADEELIGAFSNSTAPAEQKLAVYFHARGWRSKSLANFVMLEYQIQNPTPIDINNFYFGIFADWDISPAKDLAAWSASEKLAYVAPAQSSLKPVAGIQVLSDKPHAYGIDNDPAVPQNPFGLYDGFTDVEKFTAVSSDRPTAGGSGGDVSQVVSSGPWTIFAGKTITIAFALHGALSIEKLKKSAMSADSLYQAINLETEVVSLSQEVHLYPIPAPHDQIFLQVPSRVNTGEIIITNLLGQILIKKTIYPAEGVDVSIPIGNLADGFYWAKVQTNAGYVFQKIIVLRDLK